MKLKLILFITLLSSALTVKAQRTQAFKGSLTYTLGRDTVDVGNMERNGSQFKLTVISMTPTVTVNKIAGSFFPDGQLMRIEGYSYDPVKGSDSLIYTYKLWYDRDTSFIETRNSKRTSLRKYPVKVAVANTLGGDAIVFIPLLLSQFITEKVTDSLTSHHIVFNSARKFVIKRTAKDKMVFGSSVMGMFTAYLDKTGNVKSVDGIGTSFNIAGTVGKFLDEDAVIAAAVSRQKLRSRPLVLNKPDSIKATIAANTIKVIYSRPSVRNRVIFGSVVPWNRVWRTGADAATKIILEKSIFFNGKELPAGEYSIFTMPSPDGWTLMFNKKANIWGTEYDSNFDVLKVPMRTTVISKPSELLTIAITTLGDDQAKLTVSWDNIEASTVFNLK